MRRLAGRRRAARGTLVAAALLAAGACNGDGEAAEDTTTTERSTTTTTEPDDPFAVPDDITEAYVQRVLDELYRIDSEAVRLTVRAGATTPEALELLDAIYATDLATQLADQLNQRALDGFPGLKRPPGDTRVAAVEVLSANERCVFARAALDFSDVSSSPPEADATFVAIAPVSADAHNPTGWEAMYLEADLGQPVEDTCEGS